MVLKKVLALAILSTLFCSTIAMAQEVPANAKSGVVEKNVTQAPPSSKFISQR